MYFQKQLESMIDALSRGGYTPGAEINRQFKDSRLAKATKALQARNVFVAATGHYLTANSNATFTCYTPPLGFDVIVFGCSLSSDTKPTTNQLSIIRGEVRIRPPAALSDNNIQPQKAFAPGTYPIYFPCPFVLEAGDQIATDFGFNAPESADASVDTAEQQVVFFCLQVKDCLDSADRQTLSEIQKEIEGQDYTKRLILPCYNFKGDGTTGVNGQEIISIDNDGFAEATTESLSRSILVTGLSMTRAGSLFNNQVNVRMALGDSALQHSFTLGQLVKAPNLFWAYSPCETGIAGPYYSYFRLPIPHLLQRGAQLTASVIGGLNGAPTGPNQISLLFEGVTV